MFKIASEHCLQEIVLLFLNICFDPSTFSNEKSYHRQKFQFKSNATYRYTAKLNLFGKKDPSEFFNVK